MKCEKCGKEIKENFDSGLDYELCKECEEQAIAEIFDIEAEYADLDNWQEWY